MQSTTILQRKSGMQTLGCRVQGCCRLQGSPGSDCKAGCERSSALCVSVVPHTQGLIQHSFERVVKRGKRSAKKE